jgi:DNA-binding LacI/PurR family transcriptional regulator
MHYSSPVTFDTFHAVGVCWDGSGGRGGEHLQSTSIKEVAHHAGVSLGTVSNVLNRPEAVAEATRRRVLDSIDALGYVRNESARQLRAGRSRTIGMVVLDVANPFFTDVARGAEAVADEAGGLVMLCNSGEDAERESRHLDLLLQQRVQGVLITPVDTATPWLEQFTAREIPVVLVDRGAGRRNLCSVAVNDLLGGRLAVAHLLERGHRRIAFAGGPFSIPQVAERHRGAEQALAEHGHAAPLLVLETPALQVSGGLWASEQLAQLPEAERPTAVFCANDLVALGLLRGMTRQGVGVPEDVAIVGYDDIDFAASAAVPLSSVRQPREELGRTAALLLMEEVERRDRHRHRQVVFEPELVVRESSDLRRES